MNRPALFKQADIKRAVAGALAAARLHGLGIETRLLTDGTIILTTITADKATSQDELDDWRRQNG